ncbi:MAG: cell wall hydrolase [Lachnospiraceae bacterium]|nr:cell wall hydrolase [Lachnospiraceae bacterium]
MRPLLRTIGGRRAGGCLLCGVLLFITLGVPTHATQETRQALENARNKHEQTKDELSTQETSINGMKAEKDSLVGQLSNLNMQLTEVGETLEEIEGQIDSKEREINTTEGELAEAIRVQEAQYAAMKKRVQFIYEKQGFLMMDMLFGSRSFADFLNQNHYVEQLSAYDRRMLDMYIDNGEKIEAKKVQLEKDMELLTEYRGRQEAEQDRVSGLVSQTSGSIRDYEGQIASAEEIADQISERIRQEEADIKALEEKLAEEIRLSELARRSTWRNISDVHFADGDRSLLANIIFCEAGAEPYDGKLAVGAVVINRVRSGVYPDTVVGVIYQAHQFEPVATGRLALALAENRANADCYRAADEAMSGYTNVGNCVYFRTPVPGLSGIRIGGHVFY